MGRNRKDTSAPTDTPRISDVERASANALVKSEAPSFVDPNVPAVFDANVKGLEQLADKLNETGKKILNTMITDLSVENAIGAEKDVFKALRNVAARAGLLDSKAHQIEFFHTIADPQFIQIYRAIGTGILGMNIVPLVAKCIEKALEGDKVCMQWALQMTGMLPDKFEFYKDRWQMTHNETNVTVNYGDMTDAELAQCAVALDDVGQTQVTISED